MFSEFIKAFIMIFMAEMGDKSQILAMTFASKYKVKKVLIGLLIGITFNHALAILIGSQLQQLIPIHTITFLGGMAFIIFGFLSLRVDHTEAVDIKENKYGPIVTIAFLFFVGELGDKTQLAAITLSSDAIHPLFILLGTISGMLVTSLLGIYLGIKFGRRVPLLYIKVSSSLIFILFGFIKISANTFFIRNTLYYFVLVVIVLLYISTVFIFIKRYQRSKALYIKVAQELKETYQLLRLKLDDICLGPSHCKGCLGTKCLIGYTKTIVEDMLKGKDVDLAFIEGKEIKDYDQNKIEEAQSIIKSVLDKDLDCKKYENLRIVDSIFDRILQDKKTL